MQADSVNPAYCQGDYIMRVIEDFALSFCLGNVVKYVLRGGKKGATVVDLEKARWYLDREIKHLKESQDSSGGRSRARRSYRNVVQRVHVKATEARPGASRAEP